MIPTCLFACYENLDLSYIFYSLYDTQLICENNSVRVSPNVTCVCNSYYFYLQPLLGSSLSLANVYDSLTQPQFPQLTIGKVFNG